MMLPDRRTVRTVCPRNCYCTCGILVTVEGSRITAIEGDPKNPATGGHVCLKGISYARRISTDQRILAPLRRRTSGTFERVSWDAALTDIAERLDRLRRDLGPQAVLYYEASGSHGALGRLAMAFWHQFGGCTLTYGDLCWPAGLEATRLTYGLNHHNHPRLTTRSRFILLWGHNPAETNVHQMRLILEAQEQGARVALVDPRATDTSDACDVHLKLRPGTDAALALGLARVIVDAGLHDRTFLDRHATGVELFFDRLRDYPIDRVATLTGIDAAAIEDLAHQYAATKPALLIAGFGLQRHHHAGQTMRAVALLPALTGNVGVEGGGWQYANLASHVLKEPPLPPEPPAVRRAIPISRLGPALKELASPRIAGMWIEKGNPASQNPRSDLVRDAIRALDLVVVVDQFHTDTTALAHYVLPAKTMFEEDDLVTAYWHPYLQLRTKVLEPPGEVKTETEIWRLLSGQLGFDAGYFPSNVEELLRAMLPGDGAAMLERLRERPLDPSGLGDVAFGDGHFPTASGKVEFSSAEAARLWNVDPVPAYEALPEGHESKLACSYPLQLLTCKTRDRIHSQFGNLDWVRDVERPHVLDIHPDDARSRGLREGDRAVVWNGRGRIELAVHLNHGIRPGVVHVLEGRCHEQDPEVNRLTDAGVTDMNHGATFYECLVEVTRA
jgi:anaerobic selenocysteine-containing dehydrogenase